MRSKTVYPFPKALCAAVTKFGCIWVRASNRMNRSSLKTADFYCVIRTTAGLEEDPQRLQEILDGMGTGTARIIIDREASRRISEDFNLKGLENKGRYYVARVVRPDGSLIDELLVDKQNGHIQFTKRS
jgi:hypothetical protein